MALDRLWQLDVESPSSNSNYQAADIAELCKPSGLNNAMRALGSMAAREICFQGTSVSVSVSTNLVMTTSGNFMHVVGTGNISSFGVVPGEMPAAAVVRLIYYASSASVSHSSGKTTLIGGASRRIEPGDIQGLVHTGSSDHWREFLFFKASGAPTKALAASKLLGRGSAGGSGDAEEISIGTGLSISGSTLSALLTPVGAIMPYAGASAPSGWQLCYGQAISRTTYADLFAVISTTYGSGDGSTTFNVPDLRGRVVAGQDDMGGTSANRLTGQSGGVNGDTLGGTGGAETHTLTEAQMPSHTHSYSVAGNLGTGVTSFVRSGDQQDGTRSTGSAGSGSAHNNVQPTIILNYIIKE